MASGHSYSDAVELEGLEELVKSWSQSEANVTADCMTLPSGAEVVQLHGLLSEDEVAALLALTESSAKHPGHSDTRVRDCQRLMASCPSLAALLWSRSHDALASTSSLLAATLTSDDCALYGEGAEGEWTAAGLNDAFRMCWYQAGGHFGPHNDASYQPSPDRRSLLTFMTYLSSGFTGGATAFIKQDAALQLGESSPGQPLVTRYCAAEEDIVHRVAPMVGSAVVFRQCSVLHCGEPVVPPAEFGGGALKAILRTDVMFSRTPGTAAKLTPQQKAARQALAEAQRLEAAGEFAKAITFYRRAECLDRDLVI